MKRHGTAILQVVKWVAQLLKALKLIMEKSYENSLTKVFKFFTFLKHQNQGWERSFSQKHKMNEKNVPSLFFCEEWEEEWVCMCWGFHTEEFD